MSNTFVASGNHPLLATWDAWLADQSWIIPTEAQTLADRGTWLVCNDPFIAALYAAHRQGLFGPTGPRLESLYDETPDEPDTSDASRATRRVINRIVAATWEGRELDAENARTRRELEEAVDLAAFATGDGFAVRVDGENGRSRWRLVHRDRVGNPDGKPNSPTLRDGFVLQNGRIIGLWVIPGRFTGMADQKKEAAKFYFWHAADGTPNVIHKPGFRLPGMLRGITRLAPMIVMERQIHGVLESHVAAKRLQAVHAMMIEAQNPEEYKAAMQNGTALGSPSWDVRGPLSVWIKAPGTGAIEFLKPQFDGKDLTDYLTICYKIECAVLQMPIDVVLCQMGNASLSSARAGLDQFDRTNQTEQEDHIAAVTKPMDRVAVQDEAAAGRLSLPTDDWSAIMAGQHSRPPKYSTDRKKDAETMKALQDAGVSKTSSLKLFGFNAEDESELRAAEAKFDAAQGVNTASTPGQPATPVPAPAPDEPAPEDQSAPAARAWWRRAIARLRGNRNAA